MTSIIRRRPLIHRSPARSPFDALVDWNPFAAPVARGNVGRPTLGIDAYYDEGNFVVNASVPGIEPENIEVTLDSGVLRIEAEHDVDDSREDGEYLIRERSRGSIQRSIRLPDGIDIDQAEAKVENGVLTVTAPRAENASAKKLEVKAA